MEELRRRGRLHNVMEYYGISEGSVNDKLEGVIEGRFLFY